MCSEAKLLVFTNPNTKFNLLFRSFHASTTIASCVRVSFSFVFGPMKFMYV